MGTVVRLFIAYLLLLSITALALDVPIFLSKAQDRLKNQVTLLADYYSPFLTTAHDYFSPKNNDFVRHQIQLIHEYWDVRNNSFSRDLENIPGPVKVAIGDAIDKSLNRGAKLAKSPHATEALSGKVGGWLNDSMPDAFSWVRENQKRANEFLKLFDLTEAPQYALRAKRIISQIEPYTDDYYLKGRYKAYIIDVDLDQGFSTGGGSIYLTRAIMDALTDDELAGVIAHEMAHSEKGHVAYNIINIAGVDYTRALLRLFKSEGPLLIDKGTAHDWEVVQNSGLGSIMFQIMNQRSQAQEREADKRGVELIKLCKCFDPTGLERAIRKLLQRSNIMNTGSIRSYPDIYERAGIAKKEEKIVDLGTGANGALASLIAVAAKNGFSFSYLGKSLAFIRSIEIRNSNDYVARYELDGMNTTTGKLVLGLSMYNVKQNTLSTWDQSTMGEQGVLFHELYHAYFHGIVKPQRPDLYNRFFQRANLVFASELSGQREEMYEELLASYIENIMPWYGRLMKNFAKLSPSQREEARKKSKMKEHYDKFAIGIYEAYAGRTAQTRHLQKEDLQLVNDILFEGRISGDYGKDFSEAGFAAYLKAVQPSP